ncbi:MAG: hypothetical protein P1U68_15100 [Verrucomicrobiales bacterium]|nr:hypothetical protein [Verrucomicrobiales bacterium]
MIEQSKKVFLSLTPLSDNLSHIPLMKVLVDHQSHESLLTAKQFVLDLAAVAPQVVSVNRRKQESFEAELAGLEIMTQEISKEEADRISAEGLPVRGSVDLRIRTRDSQINSEMIETLKTRKLISDYRQGGNANGIFHWKDDRWYQDFHLAAFNESDIPQIEDLIGKDGYIVVRSNEEKKA